MTGGTDHVLPDKMDNFEKEELLAENKVTLFVVQNEYLGLLMLWSQCPIC